LTIIHNCFVIKMTRALRDGMTPIDEIARGFDEFVLVGREGPTGGWGDENSLIPG
jgi:hypothetical protein